MRPLDVLAKRDINFARLRFYWRIIRLKDRGIEHNFRTDRIDKNSYDLVYKAEMNRICTLGGIVFPLLIIMGCVAHIVYYYFYPLDSRFVDPHFNPNFLEKYPLEIMIFVSIVHISLSRRYVLRMYFNSQKKTFRISTWRWYLPFRTHTFECKPGSASDTTFLRGQALVDTIFGNTKVNGKRLYIEEEHFTFPVYYNVLFGYSEPNVITDKIVGNPQERIQMTERALRYKRDD